MTFVKYNHNPLNKKVGDCVVRAIGKALDLTWDKVFEDLVVIAREQKSSLNYKDVYEKYLKQYETIPVKYETPRGKKRLTVNEVCKLKGTFVILVARHLTCIIDGVNYDLWDCGNKSAYKIWRIK